MPKNSTKIHDYSKKGNNKKLFRILSNQNNCKEIINSLDHKDRTPLYYAIKNNHLSTVRLLLTHGSSLSCLKYFTVKEINKKTAALLFEFIERKMVKKQKIVEVQKQFFEVVHFDENEAISILNQLEDINFTEPSAPEDSKNSIHSFTPLHTAVFFSKQKLLKYLLQRNADVNSLDSTGSTPLHYVHRNKEPSETIDLLLEHNAFVLLKNKFMKTPIDNAEEWGKPEIVSELLKKKKNKEIYY